MNNKVAFITGISGQDGSYLAELLLEKEYKVYGLIRRTSLKNNNSRISHIEDKLHLEYGDITDGQTLINFINKIILSTPDFVVLEIYNLAAQSHVHASFDMPEYSALVDGIGTLKILEIIRNQEHNIKSKIRFYQAGTSEMFGKVCEVPQNETTQFNPQSPYACSKVFSHFMVKNYREGYGIYACNGILFNHESPRRGDHFVTKKIINGIKKMQTDEDYVLKLGNIYSKRDWGHSRDYVKGMWLMLQQPNPDDYVLSTGETYSIKFFIEKCFKYFGQTIIWSGEGLDEIGRDANTERILVKIDKKYFRPCEVDLLLGCPEKAEKILGWKREYTFDMLIDDMIKSN